MDALAVFRTGLRTSRKALVSLQEEGHELTRRWDRWYEWVPEHHKQSTHHLDHLLTTTCICHKILILDVQVRCYYLLEQAEEQPQRYEKEITETIHEVHSLCQQIFDLVPYDFNPAELQKDHSTNVRRALYHTSYNHPLLICSMVESLSNEEHIGISYARMSQAGYYNLKHPLRTFPATLVPRREAFEAELQGLPSGW